MAAIVPWRTDVDQYLAANRARWDELAGMHPHMPLYAEELAKLRAGGSTLRDLDRAEVGPVAGKRLLHLQCHLGFDTLSWARAGAIATGVDFSERSIAQARRFAAELGITARFVVSDYEGLVTTLAGERFDIVYLSYGVLVWLPDLRPAFAAAASLLVEGGALHVIDSHPLALLLDDERPWPAPDAPYLALSYFSGTTPYRFEAAGSYADRNVAVQHTASYQWVHNVQEMIDAVVDAGLRVAHLHEFPIDFYQRLPAMTVDDRGWWHLPPPLDGRLPLLIALKAVRA